MSRSEYMPVTRKNSSNSLRRNLRIMYIIRLYRCPNIWLRIYQNSVYIFHDGYGVSRSSDFIIYSVEAGSMDKVVAEYGRGT